MCWFHDSKLLLFSGWWHHQSLPQPARHHWRLQGTSEAQYISECVWKNYIKLHQQMSSNEVDFTCSSDYFFKPDQGVSIKRETNILRHHVYFCNSIISVVLAYNTQNMLSIYVLASLAAWLSRGQCLSVGPPFCSRLKDLNGLDGLPWQIFMVPRGWILLT